MDKIKTIQAIRDRAEILAQIATHQKTIDSAASSQKTLRSSLENLEVQIAYEMKHSGFTVMSLDGNLYQVLNRQASGREDTIMSTPCLTLSPVEPT